MSSLNEFSLTSCFLTLFFLFSNSIEIEAQEFEGKFMITKETLGDTTFFEYYVKKDKIRINQVDKEGNVLIYKLIDLKTNKIKLVDPRVNKYMIKTIISGKIREEAEELKIKRTGNTKKINGYECRQVMVVNEKKNLMITFWVTKTNSLFLSKLIRIEAKTDPILKYFLKTGDIDQIVPMVVVERSTLWETFSKYKIVGINNCSLDDDIFTIPSEFDLHRN